MGILTFGGHVTTCVMLAEEPASVIGRRAALAYVVGPNVARAYAGRGTDSKATPGARYGTDRRSADRHA
jgi:hypothetical protein